MGESVNGKRTESGIAKDDFGVTFGRGVALVRGTQIDEQDGADLWNLFKETEGDFFGVVFGRDVTTGGMNAAV